MSGPKTMILPSDFSMINAVPQDTIHPLYKMDRESRNHREEFLLDHLVGDTFTDANFTTGVDTTTMSGKPIHFATDPTGETIISNLL